MSGTAEGPLPHLLFIFLDELRADALGCYGHPFVQTPTMDRLAAEGVRFDQHYTNSPICVPARTAMMSSLYPHQTGVLSNISQSELGYDLSRYLTFNDDLRGLGYPSIANVGKVHIPGEGENASGPSRYQGWKTAGFDEQLSVADARGADPHTVPDGMAENDVVRGPGVNEGLRSIVAGTHPGAPEETLTGQAIAAARDYVSNRTEHPWALRVSINRPHTPVLPPRPYDSLYADDIDLPEFDPVELESRPSPLSTWHRMRGVDALSPEELRLIRQHYYGLVTFIDEQIGSLLEHVDEQVGDRQVLTIISSDHGSSLGDHGQLTKGPYDSADITRVPLIVHWPERIAEGHTFEGLSQLIDLLPTLVSLFGEQPRERYEGRSLVSALEGGIGSIHEHVFIEGEFPTVHSGRRETVRTLDWRYTQYPSLDEHELIDLQADPGETRDVSDQNPTFVNQFQDTIADWYTRTPPVPELD